MTKARFKTRVEEKHQKCQVEGDPGSRLHGETLPLGHKIQKGRAQTSPGRCLVPWAPGTQRVLSKYVLNERRPPWCSYSDINSKPKGIPELTF